MSPAPIRFRDPRGCAYEFSYSSLVRCPRCAAIAHVERRHAPGREAGSPSRDTKRVVCRGCGLSRSTAGPAPAPWGRSAGLATDPYFRLPLWLQTETRHGRIWAYNLAHLDLIRRFVAADLRERAPWYDTGQKMTLVARLPAWIKSAKNRGEVLRAIDRVRASVIPA
ncbi:hypothetical protein [Streptomyces deserti]